MSNELQIETIEIANLNLKPGDVLAVKIQAKLTPKIEEHIRKILESILPEDTPMIVMGEDVELTVIRKECELI